MPGLDLWLTHNGVWPIVLSVCLLLAVVIGIRMLFTRQANKFLTEIDILQTETDDRLKDQQLQYDELHEQQHQLELVIGRLEVENANLVNDQQKSEQLQASTAARLETLNNDKQQLQQQLARAQQNTESLNNQRDEYKEWLEKTRAELESQRMAHETLLAEHAQLKTSLKEKQIQFDDKLELLHNAKEQMKKDFELLANEILENKGKAFREINQQSIQNLLNPVQAEMKGFREKVESLHTEETKQRSELKAELLNLQNLNREITDQAEQLTTALRGQKKVQGNWGELILENVLDSSGLRLGQDYEREVSFKTEDGRKRPDAIVYLPQEKHLVIDAKTSLEAYTRYVNAESDPEREQALADHATAVNDRISELADKDYYNLPGLNTPEVVVMFIPIESAYVEALKYDSRLYQEAIKRNVLVATPTTLLTSLNIVRQLWQFEDRNKHTAELADKAEKFYNKLQTFLTSMQKVGDQLDNARDTYDTAMKQFYSGKGNLIKQASEFKDLGVSVKKELPEELLEKARLELDERRPSAENLSQERLISPEVDNL